MKASSQWEHRTSDTGAWPVWQSEERGGGVMPNCQTGWRPEHTCRFASIIFYTFYAATARFATFLQGPTQPLQNAAIWLVAISRSASPKAKLLYMYWQFGKMVNFWMHPVDVDLINLIPIHWHSAPYHIIHNVFRYHVDHSLSAACLLWKLKEKKRKKRHL